MPPGEAGKSGAWGTGLIACGRCRNGKRRFLLGDSEKTGFEEGFVREAAGPEGRYACSTLPKSPSLRGLCFAAGAFRAARGERGRRGAYGLLGKAHAFPNRHQAFGTSSRSGMVKVTVVPSPGTLSRS